MDSNVLTYKGYSARVNYSVEDRVLYGKIEGIADLVNFQCEDASGVDAAFQEAVDDYLAFCHDLGKSPEKEYRGSFNVRIQPALHRDVDRAASLQGISMNQYIERALAAAVEQEKTQLPYQIAGPVTATENSAVKKAWNQPQEESGTIVSFPIHGLMTFSEEKVN